MPSQRRRLPGAAKGAERLPLPKPFLSTSPTQTEAGWPSFFLLQSDEEAEAARKYPYRARNCIKCPLGFTGYHEPPEVITGCESFHKIKEAMGLTVKDLSEDTASAPEVVKEVLGVNELTSNNIVGCAVRIAGSRTMSMFNTDPEGCDDYYLPRGSDGTEIWSKE